MANRKQPDWRPDEDERVLAGARDLPGRSRKACQMRRHKLRYGKTKAGGPVDFTDAEDALILAGRRDLPGRDPEAVSRRIRRLRERYAEGDLPEALRRIRRVPVPREVRPRVYPPRKLGHGSHWLEADLAELMAGRRDFPGRKPLAIRRRFEEECGRIRALGKIPPAWEEKAKIHYRQNEIDAIKSGALELPGRSRVAIAKKRLALDPERLMNPVPRWKPPEVAALLQDPRAPIPGRSVLGRRHKLWQLGLRFARDYPIFRPPVVRERRYGLAASVLAASSGRSEGFDLLQAIDRALPAAIPAQVREEAVSTAALLCLEEGLDPQAAANEALRRAKRFNNLSFRFAEMNEAIHARPLWL